jgi:aryl-phospho-beta-D-glucosidase BglC (GH1 family)
MVYSQAFLHTENKKIVNGQEEEIFLKGMGLGGWMLQEGYMLETSFFANAQYEIREKISELIGTVNTDSFYSAWRANHVRRIDIDSLAEWGFNSIRLPMHYELFSPDSKAVGEYIDTGFIITDSLLSWCSDNEMYLILDLHAAPGGQGDDAAICDYDPSEPSLWESEENKARTADLWKTLAARYASEEWIGGYDLINETKWPALSDNDNQELWELMIRITDSIRTVDTNHIIFTEGNWWANDYTGFPGPWDDNLVISFHKYWNENTTGSIQWMLDMRDLHNVPLWLGETGENSNAWFTGMIRLMEQHNIGYALWPEKKINSVAGPVTILKTKEYQELLDYWNNPDQFTRPEEEFAKAALMEMAENLKLENCRINPDVIDAVTRQVNDHTAIPFKEHHIPGLIHATDYDLGSQEIAYSDTDYQKLSDDQIWNNGSMYRNDGVDIEVCTDDVNSNGFNVGWTASGEWLRYTVETDSSAAYTFSMRFAGDNTLTRVHLELDGTAVTPAIELSSTGGWSVWDSLTLHNVILEDGRHSLTVHTDYGGCNFSYFRFSDPVIPSRNTSPYQQTSQMAEIYPNPCENELYVKLHKHRDQTIFIQITDLTGKEVMHAAFDSPDGISLIDAGTLMPGTYVIRVISNEQIVIKTFIVL